MSTLLTLPPELMQKILSYISYDDASRCRSVCKYFDKNCQEMLDCGFRMVEEFHSQCLQRVKSQLPRRESERRVHPLARHCDILTAIETRLSLLSMTFSKYIDSGACCFIPGKVLDEIYSVLRQVSNSEGSEPPPRPHEVLQELRDISSMAMEYFDEKIVPNLRENCHQKCKFAVAVLEPCSSKNLFGTMSAQLITHPHSQSLTSVRQHCDSVSSLQKKLNTMSSTVAIYKKELSQLVGTQKNTTQKLLKQSRLISEQSKKIDEINRKLLEYDNRFAEVLVELRGTSAALNKSVDTATEAAPVSTSHSSTNKQRVTRNSRTECAGTSKPTSPVKTRAGAKRPLLKMDDQQSDSSNKNVKEAVPKRSRKKLELS